jgi:hypothetical protein
LQNKYNGVGWWRGLNGKYKPGEWKEDRFIKWTGPEQFESQMKAKRIQQQKFKSIGINVEK